MKFNMLVKSIAAAVMLLAGLTSGANATVIVQNVTLSDVPGFTNIQTNGRRGRQWQFDAQVTPFNVAAGDTVRLNVTFTSPVALQDFDSSNLEFATVLFWNTAISPTFSYNVAGGNLSLSGTSGDFLNPVPDIAIGPFLSSISTGGNRLEGFNILSAGNLTDSVMTLTGLTLEGTFAAIDAQNAPFSRGFLSLVDDAPVPAPAALALFGLGLFGIGGLRRKKFAA